MTVMNLEQLKSKLAEVQALHAQNLVCANTSAGAVQMLVNLVAEEERAVAPQPEPAPATDQP